MGRQFAGRMIWHSNHVGTLRGTPLAHDFREAQCNYANLSFIFSRVVTATDLRVCGCNFVLERALRLSLTFF